MKVVTVTANPCIDRTVWVDEFEKGGTNRVTAVTESVNGKGINTSVAVKNLGYPTLAVVMEYVNGESVCKYLSSVGIDNIGVETAGKLRVNTKIFDRAEADITELNCKGYPVSADIRDKFFETVLSAIENGDVLVISGSVPPGIEAEFYRDLIIKAKESGVYVILDADGDLLLRGVEGHPDMIKPNREELSRLCGGDVRDIDEAVEEARGIIAKGIGSVCISFGAKGALYVTADRSYWAESVKVDVKGTVGAGDSMVAGFAVGRLVGYSDSECFKSAMAVASGSVTLEGTELCNAELYGKMLPLITVEEL